MLQLLVSKLGIHLEGKHINLAPPHCPLPFCFSSVHAPRDAASALSKRTHWVPPHCLRTLTLRCPFSHMRTVMSVGLPLLSTINSPLPCHFPLLDCRAMPPPHPPLPQTPICPLNPAPPPHSLPPPPPSSPVQSHVAKSPPCGAP